MRKKREYTDFFDKAETILPSKNIEHAKARAQETITQIRLSSLRKSLGIKQEEVEGFTQSNVSRLENRKDLKLSTLIEYLHGLGMELEIKVLAKDKTKKSGARKITLLRA